jgi:dihydroorotate dehydrogenase
LLQIYTGFAYRGHALIEEVLDALGRIANRASPPPG